MILTGSSGPAWDRMKKYYGKSSRHFSSFGIRALNDAPSDGHEDEYMFVIAKDEDECYQLPTEMDESPLQYPSLHADSTQSFNQIQRWYSECTEKHERCIRERLPLPTRLLDVGNDLSCERVKLCDSKSLSEQGHDVSYLALSYCWGGMVGFRTLKSNIDDRKSGFSLDELPAAIHDAITVTRRSGVRYLWVDALCICQDDEQEWEDEAAAMADVYGDSLFTISSLSSPSAEVGFLGNRNLGAVSIGTITLSYGTWEDPLTVFLRKQPRGLRQEFFHAALNKRAWPLQERVLSPAVLHYGRDQLLWECNSMHLRSETGDKEDWGGIVIRLSDMVGAPHAFGPRDLWDCIIDEYTDRQLSVPSDRLQALSGLAAKLRKDGTRDGRYVAGLWESDLDFQLLWDSKEEPSTEYGESVKPNLHISTWSWAHRNLGVNVISRAGLTSNLSSPPKFRFQDQAQDDRSKQPGAIVPSCDVVLPGFVQRVGATAIRVESQPSKHVVDNLPEYPGLPGEDSKWQLDYPVLGQGPHYCLRVMDAARKTGWAKMRIHYILLRRLDADSPLETDNSYVYQRVGNLTLYSMPEENFTKPYGDILFDNGKPLLTDGEWQDVVLV
ncbi:MAG: hypothetical protein Q9216_006900 [Gyalolechia sp. 2 TL-2023]